MSRKARLSTSSATAASTGPMPFDVERIGRHLGAEIRGIDLRKPLAPATLAAFEAALIAHKVLICRDQAMTTAEHLALSRQFGELENNPFRPEGEAPEIMVIDNHKDNPVLSTDVWHADTTFRQRPTKYTILRCQIMPATGGDTLWCDMAAAWRGLSEPFRRFIAPLRAVHDFRNFRVLFSRSDADRARLHAMEDRFPNPLHPVVRTHPVSGDKAIYVNPQFTIRIDGLNDDESRAILDVLYAQARIPEYQLRHRWRPGDIVFWDNTCTQHYAANDYYPDRRRMERTAVAGDVPV